MKNKNGNKKLWHYIAPLILSVYWIVSLKKTIFVSQIRISILKRT